MAMVSLLVLPIVNPEMSWVYPIDFGVNDCYGITVEGESYTVYCTTSLLFVNYNKVISPVERSDAWYIFNTSNYTGPPSGWQVSNMSVNYYMQSYTVSGKPAPSKTYSGSLSGNVSGGFSSTNIAVAYHRWGLPSSMWANITTSPTTLVLSVPDPTTGIRSAYFRAYENDTATRAYFNITFVPTVTSTCVYSGSGNWNINCSEWCNVTLPYNLMGKNISISGQGTTTFSSNITNVTQLDVRNNCTARTNSTGGFRK